jgi:hypothetical protein
MQIQLRKDTKLAWWGPSTEGDPAKSRQGGEGSGLFTLPLRSVARTQPEAWGYLGLLPDHRLMDAEAALGRSTLLAAGMDHARILLKALLRSDAELDAVPTLDGGMTFELSSLSPDRDLLFALPDHGGVLYFTARDHVAGTRRAGIVTDETAVIPGLLAWLDDQNAEFPTRGVDLG